MVPRCSRPRIAALCGLSLVFLLLAACRPPPHVMKVQRMVADGDYDRALRQVTRELRRFPGDNALWKLLIHIHFARDDVKGAVGAYQQRAKKVGLDRELARYLSLLLLRWGMAHKDPAVRLDAVQGVRRTDASPLLRDMIERLADPHEVVRTWAAVALSASPRGANVLEEQLSSSSPEARAVAVEQVGRIAGAKAMAALVPFVKDSHPGVRAAAARALAHCRRPQALPSLVTLLGDREWQVQAAAASAVGRLGYRDGVAALTPLLASPRLGVMLAAVNALADLDRDAARPLLLKVAGGQDLMAALRAGVRLASMGSARPAVAAISRGLAAPRAVVRAAACNAASQVKDPAVVEQVARALADPDTMVRLAAARALLAHELGGKARDAGLALHQSSCAGNKKAPLVCLQAAELLALLGRPEGLATLEELARKGPDGTVRSRALSLALLRHRSSRDLALSALADDDPRVAVAAAVWLYGELK